ncbi:preprotein translocase subunit SecG [Candidiatus Paracoxiella cheracis]|uniref:preprotein translocase subunit SecG n=1 Tax=Candidiatus Paracoxiella cheracis TaxID=3405120 RepID=UPI003BF4AD65
MQQLILVLHVLVAICLVTLVLLQHGKGADVGAAFGSGASNTMFGSIGATPFLMKITILLAAIFFATSLTLGYLSAREQKALQQQTIPTQQAPTQSIPTIPPSGNLPSN